MKLTNSEVHKPQFTNKQAEILPEMIESPCLILNSSKLVKNNLIVTIELSFRFFWNLTVNILRVVKSFRKFAFFDKILRKLN